MTKTDVANLALSKIGEPIIDDITDTGDRVARLASLHYEPTLREVLRAHFWDFAMAASQSLETYAGDTKASLTLFDGVANSGIVIEAVANGPEGNEISVEILAAEPLAAVAVEVSGSAIAITPVARMVLSGTTTPAVAGFILTRTIQPTLGNAGTWDSGPTYPRITAGQGGLAPWRLNYFANATEYPASPSAVWQGDGNAYQNDAWDQAWAPGLYSPAGTGNPVSAQQDSDADEIIAAINGAPSASLLVTASNQSGSDGSAEVGTATAANLTGGATSPPGWTKAFLMPADFIKLRRVLTEDGSRIDKFDFRRIAGQRCLVTGDHDSVIMEYVQFVDDPDAYDPLFLEAFTTLLASKLARAVTGSEAMEAELRQGYEFSALPAARTADSHDSQSGENRPIDDIISGGLLRPRGDFLTDLTDD